MNRFDPYPFAAKEIKLDANYNDTSEWTKTYTDMLGRTYKTVYPDAAYHQSFYNNLGQLWKERDPDGVVTLQQYNAKGELEYTALDIDRDDVIDFGGTDRITRTVLSAAQPQPNPSFPSFPYVPNSKLNDWHRAG
jgi:hypothetical protein